VRLPAVLVALRRELLRADGLRVQGVFRLSADKARQAAARSAIDEGRWLGLGSAGAGAGSDEADVAAEPDSEAANCAAALVKEWLRSLPTPLLAAVNQVAIADAARALAPATSASSAAAATAAAAAVAADRAATAQRGEPEAMAAAAAAVVDSVPEPERSVLLWVADLLCEVARYETANLMSLRALAIVMAPNLFAVPDGLGPAEVVQHMDVCVRGSRLCFWRAR
jgi:hypothetical protein